MDSFYLKACGKCRGDLYIGNDIDGDYTKCLQCGQHYYPPITRYSSRKQTNGQPNTLDYSLLPPIQSPTEKNHNGGSNNRKDSNGSNNSLEDICMGILGDLIDNKEGLSQTFITGLRSTKAPTTRGYLRILIEGGYVTTSDRNGTSRINYEITDEGEDVFREYKRLTATVEANESIFETYRIFNTRKLTKFGSFAKSAGEQDNNYAQLAIFIKYMEKSFERHVEERKKKKEEEN